MDINRLNQKIEIESNVFTLGGVKSACMEAQLCAKPLNFCILNVTTSKKPLLELNHKIEGPL